MKNIKIILLITFFIFYINLSGQILFKCPVKICYGIGEIELVTYMDAQVGKNLISKLDDGTWQNILAGKANIKIYFKFDMSGNVYQINNLSKEIPTKYINYIIDLVKKGDILLIYPINGINKSIIKKELHKLHNDKFYLPARFNIPFLIRESKLTTTLDKNFSSDIVTRERLEEICNEFITKHPLKQISELGITNYDY